MMKISEQRTIYSADEGSTMGIHMKNYEHPVPNFTWYTKNNLGQIKGLNINGKVQNSQKAYETIFMSLA